RRRLGRAEAQVTHGRGGEGDPPEHGDAVLDGALHLAGRGFDHRNRHASPPQAGTEETRLTAWAGNCYLRFASTLSSILIFLPTSTPPVSRAWFHVRPKSSRSSSVLAEKPMGVVPHGVGCEPSNSTS